MNKATIYDLVRFCNSHGNCLSCELRDKDEIYSSHNNCPCFDDIDKVNNIILNWVDKHPENKQSEFLKKFPNVRTMAGTVDICPEDLDTTFVCPKLPNCSKCKEDYWLSKEKG